MNWTVFTEPLYGKERLSVVFWHYNVVAFLGAMLFAVLLASVPGLFGFGETNLFVGVGLVFAACYWLWATVSLWQCAFNTERRSLGYLARTYVIYSIGALVFGAIESLS